jgi:CRISPR-associated endonuclease/helicase Cas3
VNLPKPEQFAEFYQAVHGYEPLPWQLRVAKRVCAGAWPTAIALPTAAGKTACIDIAVFALACRAKNAPRRIFFVVDRRVVVDQAKLHADQLAKVLKNAERGIVKDVALALCDIARPGYHELSEEEQEQVRPLDVYALRGGIYRETAWARSPIQPTVIASTVDQVGSRLLFRGYGVSESMRPIHAGLVGNDALILLDEAHCANPFYQTMRMVEKYRSWGEGVPAPFRFVAITATPVGDAAADVERDQDDDRAHDILGPRIAAAKPAKLIVAEKATGKKKGRVELVKELARQARELMGQSLGTNEKGTEHFVRAVGVIVNRVATARELSAALKTDEAEAILLTGRMRPIDRDNVLKRLEPLFCGKGGELAKPVFVVATQCLEVGADLDFHALVTECASLDALRQRFGRLNRLGARPSAKAVVVIRADEMEDTAEDPVYGGSLAKTWQWLKSKGTDGVFDFGVAAVQKAIAGCESELPLLNAPSSDAPVLFPAHLDCWVQTNPIPSPDSYPEPALFLHGPERTGQPDVQVVFRRDLGEDTDNWAEIVSLCPPSSSEAVSVPIGVFRRWLAGEDDDQSSDVEGETRVENEDEPINRSSLRWRGPERSCVVTQPEEISPNQVYVIRCTAEGVESLGDFPVPLDDYAEETFQLSRDKALLRLPDLNIPEDASPTEEATLVTDAIQAVEEKLTDESPAWLKRAVQALKTRSGREVDRHPLGGYVITGKTRLCQFDPTYLDDSEPDDSFRGRTVSLKEHSRGVAERAKLFAAECGLDGNLYYQAGLWHDLGKLDPRFQAMLKQSSPRTAVGEPLAKSARAPRTKRERDEAREIHRYPRRARHELLSAALVATTSDDDLLLHLIATHHGSARPFADQVEENSEVRKPFKTPALFGKSFELPTSAQEIADWNASLPERFWRVVRKLGWWGAAYHEAIFRLADHAQSRAEQEDRPKEEKPEEVTPPPFAPLGDPRTLHALPLSGLDGSNPLAFLAALGTLVVLDQLSRSDDCPNWLKGKVALSWRRHTPVLHFPGVPPAPQALIGFLVERYSLTLDKHPAKFAVSLFESKDDPAKRLREFARHSSDAARAELDWAVAHFSELASDATSQLLTVRRDYFPDNLRSILSRCRGEHLLRALFHPWDYADALDNQSLHWEPSEDRRHAYQWHMPSGDPTRKKRGGMLGANRMALEAWPLFPSFPAGDRLVTRGFEGNRAASTFWTWPLWRHPLTKDAVASILGLPEIQEKPSNPLKVRDFGVSAVFRLQRILVGKTPNFTTSLALA